MEHSVVTECTNDVNVVDGSSCRENTLEHRKRAAVIIVCVQLIVSLLGFSVAMRVYVTTTNIKAGAFWSHIVLLLACLFLLIGICQHQQERSWMVVGIMANVLGILLAFIGTLVDGAQAGHIAQTQFDNCEYSIEKQEVSCHRNNLANNIECSMTVYERSCYCCYILRENHCDVTGLSLSSQPNLFRGVTSCGQVAMEYQLLLWISTVFNLTQFVIATVTISLVGRYKTLLTQSLHPTTIHQTIVGPSIISQRLHGNNPVTIINQQTVGYYPGVIQPPAYSEVVGVGSATQPSSTFGVTPVITSDDRDNITRDSHNHRDGPPDYTITNHTESMTLQQGIVGNSPRPISGQGEVSCDRETNLPPPYTP